MWAEVSSIVFSDVLDFSFVHRSSKCQCCFKVKINLLHFSMCYLKSMLFQIRKGTLLFYFIEFLEEEPVKMLLVWIFSSSWARWGSRDEQQLELENGYFRITNKITLQVTRAAESAVVSSGFWLNWSATFSFPLCVNLALWGMPS